MVTAVQTRLRGMILNGLRMLGPSPRGEGGLGTEKRMLTRWFAPLLALRLRDMLLGLGRDLRLGWCRI